VRLSKSKKLFLLFFHFFCGTTRDNKIYSGIQCNQGTVFDFNLKILLPDFPTMDGNGRGTVGFPGPAFFATLFRTSNMIKPVTTDLIDETTSSRNLRHHEMGGDQSGRVFERQIFASRSEIALLNHAHGLSETIKLKSILWLIGFIMKNTGKESRNACGQSGLIHWSSSVIRQKMSTLFCHQRSHCRCAQ
jgi:hypothetical protein